MDQSEARAARAHGVAPIAQSGELRGDADRLWGSPKSYFAWGPNFAEEIFLEGQPWNRGMPLDSWAVWAEVPEERVAALRFAPRIRFESHKKRFWIEVWGVGLWPETGDLVLVATYGYGTRSEHSLPHRWWGPGGKVAVLCHDPRLDMFRFMNHDDYDFAANTPQDLSRRVACRKNAAR